MKPLAGAEDAIIGRIVREKRNSLGMTMLALGQSIGCNYQQVGKYETGKNRIAAVTLFRIARALGMSAAEFVAEIEAELAKATNAETAD